VARNSSSWVKKSSSQIALALCIREARTDYERDGDVNSGVGRDWYGWVSIRLLVVSYGWAKTVLTQQNKCQVSNIFFIHPVVNSTKGSFKVCHKKTYFHCFRKPKCALKPCFEEVSKPNTQA
jgi:hypothetical protein